MRKQSSMCSRYAIISLHGLLDKQKQTIKFVRFDSTLPKYYTLTARGKKKNFTHSANCNVGVIFDICFSLYVNVFRTMLQGWHPSEARVQKPDIFQDPHVQAHVVNVSIAGQKSVHLPRLDHNVFGAHERI